MLHTTKERDLGWLVGKVLVHSEVDRIDERKESPEAVDLGSIASDLLHDPDIEADKGAKGHSRVEGVCISVVGLVDSDVGERLGAAEIGSEGGVEGADGRDKVGLRVEGRMSPVSCSAYHVEH